MNEKEFNKEMQKLTDEWKKDLAKNPPKDLRSIFVGIIPKHVSITVFRAIHTIRLQLFRLWVVVGFGEKKYIHILCNGEPREIYFDRPIPQTEPNKYCS